MKSPVNPAMRPTLTEERNHPNHWYNRASDLHASAGAVWYAMHAPSRRVAAELGFLPGFSMGVACTPVYYMLCGLALEVVMKAVLVQRGVPSERYETHKFSILTALLGVTLTKEDQALLQFYESSLIWAGRYPTPRHATDEKLLSFWRLASDVLTSAVEETKTIEIRSGNGAADWEHFTKLWHTYAAPFQHR